MFELFFYLKKGIKQFLSTLIKQLYWNITNLDITIKKYKILLWNITIKKIDKSNFYKNKKLFNIDDIDVNKMLISKKEA